MKKTIIITILILFFAAPARSARVVDYCMTPDPDTATCGSTMPDCVDVFNAETNYVAYLYYILESVVSGDKSRAEWYFEGQYHDAHERTYEESGDFCLTHGFVIKGSSMEDMTGNWSIDYYYNEEKLFTEKFYLEGLSSGCFTASIIENESELAALRNFRDNVLSKSKQGRALIDLYYKHSRSLHAIIKNNPELKPYIKTIIFSFAALTK